MVSVQLETLNILGHRCPVLALLDRRERQAVQKRWLFARVLEQILYKSHDRARGSLAVLLQRLSINGGCLLIDRAAVLNELVTQSEFDQVYAPRSTHPPPAAAHAKTRSPPSLRVAGCASSDRSSTARRRRRFASASSCRLPSPSRVTSPACPYRDPQGPTLPRAAPPHLTMPTLSARAQRAKGSGDATRRSPSPRASAPFQRSGACRSGARAIARFPLAM